MDISDSDDDNPDEPSSMDAADNPDEPSSLNAADNLRNEISSESDDEPGMDKGIMID